MNIYVGNLPYSIHDEDLRELFQQHGNVTSARVVMERDTSRSKGFGFVEMDDDAEANKANKAIEALNDAEFEGRRLTVNEARPREDRPRGRF